MTDSNSPLDASAASFANDRAKTALELLELETSGSNAPLKPSLSERLGDWAQALAATYASRPLQKEQGAMHRV